MKKLLLFVAAFLIMALPTVAQETDLSEEEFKQKIDSVFEHVDMTSVETGILIEHGSICLTQTSSTVKNQIRYIQTKKS